MHESQHWLLTRDVTKLPKKRQVSGGLVAQNAGNWRKWQSNFNGTSRITTQQTNLGRSLFMVYSTNSIRKTHTCKGFFLFCLNQLRWSSFSGIHLRQFVSIASSLCPYKCSFHPTLQHFSRMPLTFGMLELMPQLILEIVIQILAQLGHFRMCNDKYRHAVLILFHFNSVLWICVLLSHQVSTSLFSWQHQKHTHWRWLFRVFNFCILLASLHWFAL